MVLEHITKDFILEESLRLPGAAVAIYLLAVLLPALSVLPSEFTLCMFTIFSIPLVYIYFFSVILNHHVVYKKHLLITVAVSYILYIVSRYPFASPEAFYTYTLFFFIGGALAVATYALHYLFYLLGKWKRLGVEDNLRIRFLICFVPAFLVMLLVSWAISLFVGGFLFELTEVLK